MKTKRVQVIVGVPEQHLYPVLDAIAEAGAGVIGEYTHCSYRNPGTGRFKPSANANPALGENEAINEVEEYRIETVCVWERVRPVCRAIRAAHPYEEPVIYLCPLLEEEDFED